MPALAPLKEVVDIIKEIGGEEKRALKFCSEIDIDPIIDDTTGNFGFYNSGSRNKSNHY